MSQKGVYFIKIKNKVIPIEGLTLDRALTNYFNSQKTATDTPLQIGVSRNESGPFEPFSVTSKTVVEYKASREVAAHGYPKF